MAVPLGQAVTLVFRTYSDPPANTTPADPTSVTLDLLNPDGTPTTAVWPAGAITRDSTGVFHYTFTPADADDAGHYDEHWEAAGVIPDQAQDGSFDVTAPNTLYTSPADVRIALAGSENAPGTAAALSDNDLYDTINEAQAEVDARLEGRYSTPFTHPPLLVITITRSIAAYLATLVYRRGEPIQPGDPVLLRYQRAQTLLGQIASGQTVLPAPPPQAAGTTVAAASQVAVVNPVDGDLWSLADFDLARQPTPAWPQVWP